jgi:hypothetical protein
MSKKHLLYLFIIISTNISCKEIYYPKIKSSEKVLVVEALFTDDPGLQFIKLSKAVPLDTTSFLPAENAVVYIKDNLNNYFNFDETKPGYYLYKGTYKPVTGRTYQLFIKTDDENEYFSSPQVLQPKGNIDSLYGAFNTKTYVGTLNNELIYNNFEGVDLYGTIHSSEKSYYRFSALMIVEHFYYLSDTLVRCWIKRNPFDFFMLNNKLNSSGEYQQSLGFLPTNLKYYGITDVPITVGGKMVILNMYFEAIVLTVKQFRVNQDVYEFYHKVNEQLQAQNRIFDPVALNITGNMSCMNNPDKPVLGVFEVASVNMLTIFFHQPWNKNIRIHRINTIDMENIPYSGNYGLGFWFK